MRRFCGAWVGPGPPLDRRGSPWAREGPLGPAGSPWSGAVLPSRALQRLLRKPAALGAPGSLQQRRAAPGTKAGSAVGLHGKGATKRGSSALIREGSGPILEGLGQWKLQRQTVLLCPLLPFPPRRRRLLGHRFFLRPTHVHPPSPGRNLAPLSCLERGFRG